MLIDLRAILSKIILSFFLSFVLISCRTKTHTPVSFYYWKQGYALSKPQQDLLNQCETKRLYVKFFDVVLDEQQQAKPTSKIDFQEQPNMEVVPCVFIQNEVFEQTHDTKRLAKKVAKLILEITAHQQLKVHEVQIDCDWTKGTKDAYFRFLETMKSELGTKELACTIRLHQIKYQESSGVPPVKKGLLMCYNMDDIDKVTTPNSILSSKVFQQYITENAAYPIKLDLALPIYQWGLVFRLGKLGVIVNDLSLKELQGSPFLQVDKNTFLVKENTTIRETNVCKGDLIRHEASSTKELFKLANILTQTNLTFEQVIFYHLSQEHISSQHAHTLSQINRLIP